MPEETVVEPVVPVEPVETPEVPETPEAPESNDSKSLLGGDQEEGAEGDAPEYEFTMPEGMEMDADLVAEVTPLFKEAGISKETAQKLADVYAKKIQSFTDKSETMKVDAWTKQVNDWKEEVTKDLGPDLKESLTRASNVINKFGSKKLREELDDSGFGNNPELIKLLSRVGRVVSEDTFVDPENNSSSRGEMDLKKFYPTMKE